MSLLVELIPLVELVASKLSVRMIFTSPVTSQFIASSNVIKLLLLGMSIKSKLKVFHSEFFFTKNIKVFLQLYMIKTDQDRQDLFRGGCYSIF